MHRCVVYPPLSIPQRTDEARADQDNNADREKYRAEPTCLGGEIRFRPASLRDLLADFQESLPRDPRAVIFLRSRVSQ